MDDFYKEVDFYNYCRVCKHWGLEESEQPCFECLDHSLNLYSHKPIKWEGKKGYEDYVVPYEERERRGKCLERH